MEDRNEFVLHIESLYNEWIEREENRNISYGEIAYIESLNDKELQEFEDSLINELYEV